MESGSEASGYHRYSLRTFINSIYQFLYAILRVFICCPSREEPVANETPMAKYKPEARILVLGASDTGKSTFMKQMRLEFGDQYPNSERIAFIPDIRHNVFGSIHKLVTAVLHFDLEYGCESTKEKSTRFTDMSFLEVLTKEDDIDPSWARDIAFLWQDQAIQEAYMRGNEFHLMTNAEHFITSAERILAENYKPTIDDILRMRLITRSSVTKTYELTSIRMTLHDMGGQRPDRNEWIRQLHEPSAIIFLASLSEYNQTVEEASERKNRVQESLDIFNDLLGYSPFENTPVILLLNKSDIFSTKIRTQPLKNFFPDYDGPEGDEITGRDYITTLYEKSSEKHRRNLLVRYTEATNTENFKAIFSFVNNYVSRCVIGIGGLH